MVPCRVFLLLLLFYISFGFYGGTYVKADTAALPSPVPWSSVNETCTNQTILGERLSACFVQLPPSDTTISMRLNTSGIQSTYLIVEMSRENFTVDAFRYAGRTELSVRDADNHTLATDSWGAFAGLPYVFVVLNQSQFVNGPLSIDIVANYTHVWTSAPEFAPVQGPIRLRFADALNETCGLGPFSNRLCWGNGTCNTDGQCTCNGTFVGQYCSARAPNISLGVSQTSLVNFSTFAYYQFFASGLNESSGTNYAVKMTWNEQAGCPELYVKQSNESYTSMPVFLTFYPNNNFPTNYTDANGFLCGYTTQNVLLPPNAGSYWVTVANRNCTPSLNQNPESPANVTLQVFRCGGNGAATCPPPSSSCTNPNFLNSWYFLLPILFGGIAGVLGIGLLLAWLFPRRQLPMDPGVLYAMGPYVTEEEARRLLGGGIRILPLRGRHLVRLRLPPIPQEKIEAVFPAATYSIAEAAAWRSTSTDSDQEKNAPTESQEPAIATTTSAGANDSNLTSYMVLEPSSAQSNRSAVRGIAATEATETLNKTSGSPASNVESALDQRQASIAYSNVTCPVCLEDFSDGDRVRRVGCHHLFHTDCIDPWLRKHPACPVCREDFSALLRGSDVPNGPRSPEPVAQSGDVERGITAPASLATASSATEPPTATNNEPASNSVDPGQAGSPRWPNWLRIRIARNRPATSTNPLMPGQEPSVPSNDRP